MRAREITQLVNGTSDPAFAVDGLGSIAAWNNSAAETFGISSENAIGRLCSEVVRGKDGDGWVCSNECVVKQAAKKRHPVRNFDIQISAPKEPKWFNVSVIIVDLAESVMPYAIHILRLVDLSKRVEMILRELMVNRSKFSRDGVLTSSCDTRTLAREASLTKRELEILRLAAKSETSASISEKLNISPKTVDNHLQHILKKLNAHSRLEAVLRAEHAGLL